MDHSIWTYPPSRPGQKTPPRPLREALRMGLSLWEWVCSLRPVWPEGIRSAASSEIRTLGLNSPTFVLWNLSWHGYRALVPVRIAAGEGRMSSTDSLIFRIGHSRCSVSTVDSGLGIGSWHVLFPHFRIRPCNPLPGHRLRSDQWTPLRMAGGVGMGVCVGEHHGWSSRTRPRWRQNTGASAGAWLGSDFLPAARRPGLPIRGLEWVEAGTFARWACEMELDASWAWPWSIV